MKKKLRKYYFSLRKNKYYNLKEKDFSPLHLEIARYKNKTIGSYYSINFELDLKILNTLLFKKGYSLSLPFIHEDNQAMEFKEWNSNDVLQLNKYGIPQTFMDSKTLIPDIFLVPSFKLIILATSFVIIGSGNVKKSLQLKSLLNFSAISLHNSRCCF